MGREIAEAVPEAMEVYRVGSRGDGNGSRAPLLRVAARGARRDRGAAADARRNEPCDPRRRSEGRLEPDVVVGHSVGEFAALASVGAMARARRSGSCASAGWRWRRRRASARARWPRSSVSRTSLSRRCAGRSSASGRRTTTAPARSSSPGENEAVEECCAEAESLGARRAIKLKVSGAFHSPLVARRRDRLKPAIDRIRFADPVAPFMSTVTAKIEPAQRLASLLVDQLTAPVRFTQAAGELLRRRRHDVRRDRPGQRPLRARQADRPQRRGRSPSTTSRAWRRSRRR